MAATEHTSTASINSLDYPTSPESRSARKGEFAELPNRKLRYVKRMGKYHYFRRRGFPTTHLPGQPFSPEYMAAYNAALSAPPVIPVSLSWRHWPAAPLSNHINEHGGTAAVVSFFPIPSGAVPLRRSDPAAMPNESKEARRCRKTWSLPRWDTKVQTATGDSRQGCPCPPSRAMASADTKSRKGTPAAPTTLLGLGDKRAC